MRNKTRQKMMLRMILLFINPFSRFMMLLIMVVLILPNTSYGQLDYFKYSDDFYPKSPAAEGLVKYIDFPVDNSSGAANITIPIHTLRVNGFELPISLNYHTGGIKLNRMASNVGLGWSLSAGGLITRTVKGGIPDEGGHSYPSAPSNVGYLNSSNHIPDNKDVIDDVTMACGDMWNEFYYDPIWLLDDMEPDIFQFSCPGLSGSFIHDYQANIHLIPEQDIQVSNISQGTDTFDEWLITKPDGTKYFFKEKEQSSVDVTSSSGPVSSSWETSAWKLDMIITIKKDTILFIYDDTYLEGGSDLVYGSESIKLNDQQLVGGPSQTTVEKHNQAHRLNEIRTKTETVLFEYDNNSREDDEWGGNALNDISIKAAGNNELIKKYKLVTGYFTGDPSDPDYDNVPDYSFKRLRLDEVEIRDGSNQKVGSYELSYNKYNYYNQWGTANPSYTPPRLSRAVDHWGYYNGKDENGQLIPSFLHYRVAGTQLVNGAERSANEHTKKAFVLDEVKYPTGGVVKFYYDSDWANYAELNTTTLEYETANRPAGGLVLNRTVYDPGDGVPIETQYEYSTGLLLLGSPEYSVVDFCSRSIWGITTGLPQCGERVSGVVYSDPINSQVSGSPNRVIHSAVTVSQTGNGRIEYLFNQDAGNQMDLDGQLNFGGYLDDFPRSVVKPFVNFGQAKRIDYFDESDQLKKRVLNNYNTYYRRVINEFDYHAVKRTQGICETLFTPYSIYSGFSFLASSTEEIHEGSEIISKTTGYDYNHFNYDYHEDGYLLIHDDPAMPSHHQVHSIISSGSMDESTETNIKYIIDYPSNERTQVMGEMVDNFLISHPVEMSTSMLKNGYDDVVNAQYLHYKSFDGYYGIGEVYNFTSKQPIDQSVFSVGSYAVGQYYPNSNLMYMAYEYKYNRLGRLIEQKKANDVEVSYLYHPGYSDPAYVLLNANSENVAYTSFEYPEDLNTTHSMEDGWVFPNQLTENQNKTGNWSLLNGTLSTTGHDASKSYVISFWAKKSGSGGATVQIGSNTINVTTTSWKYYEVNLSSIPQTLNVNVASAYIDEVLLYPADAQISVYSFDPIGMINQIDPNGKTTFYEYDDYGRLQLIKDHNSDILKGYKYKYVTGN